MADDLPGKPNHVLLVVNAKSRKGRDSCNTAIAALSKAGIDVSRRDCSRAADLPHTIVEARDRVDAVVIGGGDGTLNAALPGLLETNLPLGIIPLGTANDLARTVGVPLAVEQAVALIAEGNRQRVDVGEVNGIPFFNVASIGFGVDLTRALTRDSKKRWGILGYVIAGLRVLHRARPFTATIRIGEKIHYARTLHLAIGNGRHYGGGMTISENASIDDNRLDVYSLEVSGVVSALKLLPSLRTGTQGRWAEVETMAGQEVIVETPHPHAVNADGEIVTRTPAHFRILPHALSIFVPQDASTTGRTCRVSTRAR